MKSYVRYNIPEDKEGETPACFDSREQYLLWRYSWGPKTELKRSGYCTDCLPEYQQRMMWEWRCSYPKTKFVRDEDGFIAGLRY